MSKATIHHRGQWQQAYKATEVPCSDGKLRTVWLTGEADTFFSIPGRVSVKGKTVTGFLYAHSDGVRFEHFTHRKNGHLLPEWGTADATDSE